MATTGFDAIYDKDDREFITKRSDKKLQSMAKSIGYIIQNDYVKKGFFKTLLKAVPLGDVHNLCPNVKFTKALSNPVCTGFLIGPDIMVSAGHCFQNMDDCQNKSIIFDVDSNKQRESDFLVNSSNVFSCKEILAQSFAGESDYSIIKLNKVPKNRAPLKLNRSRTLELNDQVFMMGHPFGLPLVLSHKTKILENTQIDIFKTTLDSFEGNSGSPVINAKTFLVEGILISGQEDLVQDSENLCYRYKVHTSGGEGVFRASELPTL